jgi:integrase/recombinase XerD
LGPSQSDDRRIRSQINIFSKLRQRFVEDMRIKGLQPKTQTMYLRAMPDFTRFLQYPPDSATPEELRAFQRDMKERGVDAPTFNNRLTVLSFFFATTCPRPEIKRHMRYQRAAKKIPVVLSAEEVARIIDAAPGPGLRYRTAFSVAYGGGLRPVRSPISRLATLTATGC